MDFAPSDRVSALLDRVRDFMEEHVDPVEREAVEALDREVRPGVAYPDILLELRERARGEGLWNLFLPDERFGPGLTNWEYGMLCELMGRSGVAPMVFNCSAPDTGNMEILAEHGTDEQKERWLQPLLDGEIRSCFSMTEPNTSGSDPTQLVSRAELDGDEWVVNGHKWFTSGYNGASIAIAMVVTDPDAPPHKRASMILVPIDTPGFTGVRPVPVMGHDEGPGHWEVLYEDCRVPAANVLGERGAGFSIAQDRLGPGRIHHCMRAIGSAERAFELMCRRAHERESFGGPLAEKQFVQDFIAKSRMEIDSGAPDGAARRVEDGHRGQARRPPGHLDDQGDRGADAPARARPRDAGARRPRHVRRRAAGRPVAPGALAPDRRRARRGPQDGHRTARAQPFQAARAGRGLRLSSEQEAFVEAIRDFAARERFERPEDAHSDEVAARMGELGWYGLQIPEEYGGSGGSFLDATLFLEETARGRIPVAGYGVTLIVVGALNRFGTEDQKRDLFGRVVRGGTLAIAMSEPEAGSDVAALKTRARRENGSWVLDGSKMWCSYAHKASHILIVCRTGAGERHEDMSMVLVPRETEGMTITPIPTLGGEETNEIHLDAVRVPEDALLGTAGGGWTQLMAGLNYERTILAATALGLAQRTFDDALAYSKERRQFGRPVGSFQALSHRFAELATEIAQVRLLVRWVASLTDEDPGRMLPQEASMAKLAATELAKRCALEGMQMMGGYGYATEYPMERYLRSAVVGTIYGGTSEIQKNIIAKTLGL